MRGALCAQSALHSDPAAAREGNGSSNLSNLDRGSCNRSPACPNGIKDVSSSCEAAVGPEKLLTWDDGHGGILDDGGPHGGASDGAEMDDIRMMPPKVEEPTIDTEEAAGVHESSLAKLKRKIRLRLLAEETRNSQLLVKDTRNSGEPLAKDTRKASEPLAEETRNWQLIAAKAEAPEYTSVERQEPASKADDGGPSTSRVCPRAENRNPCSPPELQQQQQQKPSQQACGPPQRKNGLVVRVENGRTIVDLSSDDEADVPDPAPRFQQQQNKHQSQRASQAPGIAAAPIIRAKQEEQEEVYSGLLERVLGPLLAKVAAAAVEQSAAAAAAAAVLKNKSTATGRSKSNSKAASKSNRLTERPLSGEDSLPKRYRNSGPAAAARRKKGSGAPSGSMGPNKTPTKRGRPKGAKTTAVTTTKSRAPANLQRRELRNAETETVPDSYEDARDKNILRNKAFLLGLNLSAALESKKQQTAKPQSRAAAAPVLRNYCDADGEEEEEDVTTRYSDLQTEHRVESQKSQITSASALSGSSSAFQRSEKSLNSDDELYEPKEEELEELEENDDNSSKSSKPPAMRGRVKPAQKKGKEKDPRGRPKKASATAPNEELLKVLTELLTSKTAAGSLPPNLLKRLEKSTSNGGASDQTDRLKHRGRQAAAASRNKSAEAQQQKPKRKAESSPQQPQQRSSSPTSSRSACTGKKQRKDTWLTATPFETPKTDYERMRDEAVRHRNDQLDKLAAVTDLLDTLKPHAPRQTRPYHKRWTSEPNPVYNRQTRLRNRLNKKNETAPEVKEEVVELDDMEEPAGERVNTSLADSLIAKFSNWATLQKHRGPSATSRADWDLNEPSESSGSRVLSFQAPQEGREEFLDPFLTRIHSMDVGVIGGQHSGLLAVGGSQGRIAVFALRASEAALSSHGSPKLGRFSDDDEPEAPSRAPLLAWSVDSSWISQVLFMPSQFKEKEMLLLSSSHDGRVVLWDVNRVRLQKGTRELSKEGLPRVVCHTTTLHSGSIFGMHEMDGRMATASEDGVGISAIRETMIFMERCITGHHSDVIRHIRFRDKNVLADCGADMGLGILDLRCPEPCTLKLTTAHKTSMSMVEWSPASDTVLLSASLDPQIYLHDIRHPRSSAFWHALDSHVHPRRHICYAVYRPAFVDGGSAVASPGEGTHQLSLYAVDTGSAIGKVHLGYDSTILHWSGLVPSAEGGLWAGGANAISHCKPCWRLPDCTGQYDSEVQPSSRYGDASEAAADPCSEELA